MSRNTRNDMLDAIEKVTTLEYVLRGHNTTVMIYIREGKIGSVDVTVWVLGCGDTEYDKK